MTGLDRANPDDPRVALRVRIEEAARELGFALVGVARAAPSTQVDRLRRWLDDGRHGEMSWIAERTADLCDVRRLLRGARSVICVADRYHDGRPDRVDARAARPRGRIARYARGKDYHSVIRDRLRKLARIVRASAPGCEARITGDIHPILEREQAARALLGAAGRHTLLIRPGLGSWFLLGEIVTDADVAPSDLFAGDVLRADDVAEPDLTVEPSLAARPGLSARAAASNGSPVDARPSRRSAPLDSLSLCGTCTRCIDACPTGAIRDWSVDATRCTAYLTIEHRSEIPDEFFGTTGDWWFGCDVCQEVCPHAQPTRASRRAGASPLHAPRVDSVDLLEVLGWTEEDRARLVVSSALKRASLAMMKRNALLALASVARAEKTLVEPVRARAGAIAADVHEDAIVRAAARACVESLGRSASPHPNGRRA